MYPAGGSDWDGLHRRRCRAAGKDSGSTAFISTATGLQWAWKDYHPDHPDGKSPNRSTGVRVTWFAGAGGTAQVRSRCGGDTEVRTDRIARCLRRCQIESWGVQPKALGRKRSLPHFERRPSRSRRCEESSSRAHLAISPWWFQSQPRGSRREGPDRQDGQAITL